MLGQGKNGINHKHCGNPAETVYGKRKRFRIPGVRAAQQRRGGKGDHRRNGGKKYSEPERTGVKTLQTFQIVGTVIDPDHGNQGSPQTGRNAVEEMGKVALDSPGGNGGGRQRDGKIEVIGQDIPQRLGQFLDKGRRAAFKNIPETADPD